MIYRAFVSSTFKDLEAHRARVIKNLRQAGIHVDPMEDWTATSEEPKQFSMERVKGCDLCVLLVGFRRGFVPEGETLSITQMEYKTADEQGVEVLVFLGKEGVPWHPDYYELKEDPALKQWRDELQKKHGAGFFDYDPQSLDVSPAIARWLQKKERGAPESAIVTTPEWEPMRLEALVDRWTSEFASQISAGHQDIASEGSARYVDLFVQNRESGETQPAPHPFADLLSAAGSRSIVYGTGGSGKSTVLLKLAAELAQRAVTEPEAPIPLYLRLNMFDSIERGFERLLEIIGRAVELPADDLKDLWLEGKRPLLFLLDGYNEVAPDCQQACAKALQELAQVSRHSILVTSRPTVPVDFLLPYRFKAVDIVQFTDEQIKDFLNRANVSAVYDDLTNTLKELGRNPFMLWALAQSCVVTRKSELPSNKGELYRNFVDHYIFEDREAKKVPRPTVFNYKWVKKPILSTLALEMCRAGLTHLPEDIATLQRIRDELKRIRLKYEDLLGMKPHVFMPESANPKEFLDEVITNGIMRRAGDAVEFIHHSIRDYFAAVALLAETPESISAEVPEAYWIRLESFPHVANEHRSRLYDAIVMCSGLMAQSDPLIAGLEHKDPLLAAECLAAGNVSSETTRAFCETCLALLRDESVESRFIGCSCVYACRIATDKITEAIEQILFSDDEWDMAQYEALRALTEAGSDTLVPTFLRTIGSTTSNALLLKAVLETTKRIYGQEDFPLYLGLLLWNIQDSNSPIQEREGLKRRKEMYSLYQAGHTPEELVDLALDPGSVSSLAIIALLRLLHRSAAVKRLLEIIEERQNEYQFAMLVVPQLEANDEIANVLRHVLEDRESSFAVKLDAAVGLACIALQQNSALSRGLFPLQISWDVRGYLVQRAFVLKLAAHDQLAARLGLAKGAEHAWLEHLLHSLRDPAEHDSFRILTCSIRPDMLGKYRADWVQVYELSEKGNRVTEFATGLLERALEDESAYLRDLTAVTFSRASLPVQEWVLAKFIQQLDDQNVSPQSRKAAVYVLGMSSTNEARAKVRELIRDAGQPAELIAEAIRSLASSPDPESALQELDTLVAEAPQNATFRNGRSLCLAALNRTEAALEDALLAVKLSANDAQLHVCLGDIRRQNEQIQEAISSYRRAVELNADYAEAHWGLAAVSSALKNTEEAVTEARRAVQLGTPTPEQLFHFGWYAYENGDFQESVAASQRAAQLIPIDAMPVFNVGLAQIAAGNTIEATRVYEAAIDCCFAFPSNESSLVGALGDLDKLQESRPELRSTTNDIQRRLRECEKRLKELAG